jgi:enoyl-CoA hydratase/carnithine racemase
MATSATAATQGVLLRSDAGGVVTLTMNRPEARNALSVELMTAMREELRAIEQDRAIRVVVIAGSGPAFSAGHDLREMRANPGRQAYETLFAQCSDLMLAIMRLPQPVIAKVHATAFAAGCQLVASCDLAVASTAAKFATPGVNIGLFCSTPMVAVSRDVPRKRILEMLLTGDAIDAETAATLGLVNRAVPPERLDAVVGEFVQKIIAKSPYVLKIGKEAFYRQLDLGIAEAYAYASEVMTINMLARDAAEGIDAFLQRRPPTWEGR